MDLKQLKKHTHAESVGFNVTDCPKTTERSQSIVSDTRDRYVAIDASQNYGPFLDSKDAARYLGYKPDTLRKWRQSGRGPSYRKIGRAVRYRLSDLDSFMPKDVYKNTAEAYHRTNL